MSILTGSWKSIATIVGPALVGFAVTPSLNPWLAVGLFTVGAVVSGLAGIYTAPSKWMTSSPITNKAVVTVLGLLGVGLLEVQQDILALIPDNFDFIYGAVVGAIINLGGRAVPSADGEMPKADVVEALRG